MNIKDKVREESGKDWWKIPRPSVKHPAKWLRFNCPFCHAKGKRGYSAAINYRLELFECFRCGIGFGLLGRRHADVQLCDDSLSEADKQRIEAIQHEEFIRDKALYEVLDEYQAQVNSVIRKVLVKYGGWIDYDYHLLYNKAAEMMWNYAFRPSGGPNDAGMLDEWETKLAGNRDKLNAYVYQALYGDLMNYAQTVADWKRKSGLRDVGEDLDILDIEPVAPVKDDGISERQNSPLESAIQAKTPGVRHGVSGVPGSGGRNRSEVSELDANWRLNAMANSDKVAFRSWGMHGCELIRSGGAPKRGHCAECDKHLTPRDIWEVQCSKPVHNAPLATGRYLEEALKHDGTENLDQLDLDGDQDEKAVPEDWAEGTITEAIEDKVKYDDIEHVSDDFTATIAA